MKVLCGGLIVTTLRFILTLIHCMQIHRALFLPLHYSSSSMYCWSVLSSSQNPVKVGFNWVCKRKEVKQTCLKVVEDNIHAIYLAFILVLFKIVSCLAYSADHFCAILHKPTTTILLNAFSRTPFCPFWSWKIAAKHQLKCSWFMFEGTKNNLRVLPFVFYSFFVCSSIHFLNIWQK